MKWISSDARSAGGSSDNPDPKICQVGTTAGLAALPECGRDNVGYGPAAGADGAAHGRRR